jgi:choline kinase
VRAVILAAGRGGRLCGVVGDRPKCLARIGDSTLLERQIRSLHACGIQQVAVVAGHRAADVQRVCGAATDVVHNSRYASTNSLYSLWLARDLLTDGFVVMNADVLFHPQLLSDLLTSHYDDAVLVASRGRDACYTDEEMKVQVRGGLVTAMDKALTDAQTDGENVGIARFGAEGAAVLVEHMTRMVSAGDVRDWLPRAFDTFCRIRPLHVVDTRGLPWIEIDYPEDYWRACTDVLPAIEPAPGRTGTAASAAGRTLHHV